MQLTLRGSIEAKQHLWSIISELYLDTELQPYELEHIAKHISECPYSLEEVRLLDKHEVFPVLHLNLMTTAGVWDGFDEEWLFTSIIKRKKRCNFLTRRYYNFVYFCMKGMFKEEWRKIEVTVQTLKSEN